MAAAALLRLCTMLALAAAHVHAQLTATIPTGRPHSLGAGQHALLFQPAASKISVEQGVLLPDVPGEYVVGSSNGSQYIQAVDLVEWAADAVPIMRDEFGANASPADSATGSKFWMAENATEGCSVREDVGTGLGISSGGGAGLCGLRTREGCPALEDGSATGCGFASGATTLNPFNDRLQISLGNLTLSSAAAEGAVRLTSNETARGAIELFFNGSVAALRWAPCKYTSNLCSCL